MSPRWTAALRAKLHYSENDADFFIDWADYLTFFCETTICLQDEHLRGKLSSTAYDFHKASDPRFAFFQFRLEKKIDCKTANFGV